MANISELELQNLRHLIGGFDTTHCKLKEYAACAEDAKVKQFFEKGAKSAMENKQQLMKFLQQVADWKIGEKTDAYERKNNGSRYIGWNQW